MDSVLVSYAFFLNASQYTDATTAFLKKTSTKLGLQLPFVCWLKKRLQKKLLDTDQAFTTVSDKIALK